MPGIARAPQAEHRTLAQPSPVPVAVSETPDEAHSLPQSQAQTASNVHPVAVAPAAGEQQRQSHARAVTDAGSGDQPNSQPMPTQTNAQEPLQVDKEPAARLMKSVKLDFGSMNRESSKVDISKPVELTPEVLRRIWPIIMRDNADNKPLTKLLSGVYPKVSASDEVLLEASEEGFESSFEPYRSTLETQLKDYTINPTAHVKVVKIAAPKPKLVSTQEKIDLFIKLNPSMKKLMNVFSMVDS